MGTGASLPSESRWKELREEFNLPDTFQTPDQIRDLIVVEKTRKDDDEKTISNKTKDSNTNAENLALRALHVLKHDPPKFRYFDPIKTEQRSVWIKEVKLPRAKQTHEVCFEPLSRHVLVSQMSSSVLVRIKVRDDGFLEDDQDAWTIGKVDKMTGEGISGLHNISLSHKNRGCVWLSLQYANTIILVEVETMIVRKVMRVPIELKDGTKIGGPHCVRECTKTGRIFVALKGAIACHPQTDAETKTMKLKQALERACCNVNTLKDRMKKLQQDIPSGFAVWCVDPSRYDPESKPCLGGVLFECLPSPPMMIVSPSSGDCFVCQDRSNHVLHISNDMKTTQQIKIKNVDMTGPGICISPQGTVFCTLLTRGDGALLGYCPKTNNKIVHVMAAPMWVNSLNIIHMTFSGTTMYAITSDLLEEKCVNALVILKFRDDMKRILARRIIPLTTQDCACHRIELVKSLDNQRRTVVISEFASSKILQIDVTHVDDMETLRVVSETGREEEEDDDENGWLWVKYDSSDEKEGHRV